MLVRLIEIVDKIYCQQIKSDTQFTFQDTFINPEYVIKTEPANIYKKYLTEGKLPDGLGSETEFTKIYLNSPEKSSSVIVVGNQYMVNEKLFLSKKTLLKG